MTFVNRDAINRAIRSVGEKITITHYRGSQSYTTAQVPSRTSKLIYTKAEIKAPNKRDIESSSGKITVNDKKFLIEGAISVSIGDLIVINREGGDGYNVKMVGDKSISGQTVKILAFASKIE